MADSPPEDKAERQYKTTDLTLAAWLSYKGLVVRSALRGRRGRFMFRFADPKGEAVELRRTLLSSEVFGYDSHLRALKKMLDEGPQNGD